MGLTRGLLVIVIGLALSEVAARLITAPASATDYSTFTAERRAMAGGTIWHYETGALTPDDYTGRYFTVRDGYRVTVGQSVHFTRTIWLFGGSTMFDTAVADPYTLASQLQALDRADRVVNVGMWAANTTLLVARLRQTPLAPGDIVIFYAGLNDANGPAFAQPSPLCGSTLAVARLICDDLRGDPALAQPFADDYARNIRAARAYAESCGVSFVNVLQPYYWSRPVAALDYQAEQVGQAERAMWPLLQASGVVDLDLTHALDGARATHEVYVETQHVNEEADGVLARAIWDYLRTF